MFPLVEQWLKSGEKQADFCQFHSVRLSTFSYWVKKFREDQGSDGQKSSGFVSLSVAVPPVSEIKLTFPNGVKIQMGSSVNASFLRELAGQC